LASDGRQGISYAVNGHYDVVLMDLQMPVLDGYESLSELKRIGYKVPIVALTAHALKEERDRTEAAGFAAHLTKPIDRALLFETIERLIKPDLQTFQTSRSGLVIGS
jgi:CheY-like chemotaxis protein